MHWPTYIRRPFLIMANNASCEPRNLPWGMNGAPDKPDIILLNWSAYTISPFLAESGMTIGYTSNEGLTAT